MSTDAAALLSRCRFPEAEVGPVDLAVSGGADSLALMALAAEAGLTGTAIHVDHGLRPESAEEAEVVARAAERFEFAMAYRTVEVDPGPDLEARARRARYLALPVGVLTGHTMDDQAETVLLNIVRGAALDGLTGMRRSGGEQAIVRPLLGIRRHETQALCRDLGLNPVLDPTNRDPRFRRNRVRSEVLPLLCEVSGRDVVPVLARQAELLADDARLLDELSGRVDATDARSLRDADISLARRAVRRWLRHDPAYADDERHPPSFDEVARILAVAGGEAVACQVAGGRRVQRRAGRLMIVSQ